MNEQRVVSNQKIDIGIKEIKVISFYDLSVFLQSKPLRPDIAGYEACCGDEAGQNQFDLVMLRL
jgi:hypothetical protein